MTLAYQIKEKEKKKKHNNYKLKIINKRSFKNIKITLG